MTENIVTVKENNYGFGEEEMQKMAELYEQLTGKTLPLDKFCFSLEKRIVFKIADALGIVGMVIVTTSKNKPITKLRVLAIGTEEQLIIAIKKIVANLLEDDEIPNNLIIETGNERVIESAKACGFASLNGEGLTSSTFSLILTRENYLKQKQVLGDKEEKRPPAAKHEHNTRKAAAPKPVPEGTKTSRKVQIKILRVLFEHPTGIFQNILKNVSEIPKGTISLFLSSCEEIELIKREPAGKTFRIIPDIAGIKKRLNNCGINV